MVAGMTRLDISWRDLTHNDPVGTERRWGVTQGGNDDQLKWIRGSCRQSDRDSRKDWWWNWQYAPQLPQSWILRLQTICLLYKGGCTGPSEWGPGSYVPGSQVDGQVGVTHPRMAGRKSAGCTAVWRQHCGVVTWRLRQLAGTGDRLVLKHPWDLRLRSQRWVDFYPSLGAQLRGDR